MKVDITNYRCVHRRLAGSQFTIFFENREDKQDVKTLQVDEVAGFLDDTDPSETYSVIRIDERGGSYNLDLSMRLSRPEIAQWKEAFIFRDPHCVDFALRVAGRQVTWRDFKKEDQWLRDLTEDDQ